MSTGSESGGAAPQSLPSALRTKLESQLGRDFSDVKIHANSAQPASLGARAFTVGNDIYFGPGQYQPHSPGGRKLLAHELTHVMQQDAGRTAPPEAMGALGGSATRMVGINGVVANDSARVSDGTTTGTTQGPMRIISLPAGDAAADRGNPGETASRQSEQAARSTAAQNRASGPAGAAAARSPAQEGGHIQDVGETVLHSMRSI